VHSGKIPEGDYFFVTASQHDDDAGVKLPGLRPAIQLMFSHFFLTSPKQEKLECINMHSANSSSFSNHNRCAIKRSPRDDLPFNLYVIGLIRNNFLNDALAKQVLEASFRLSSFSSTFVV
jgi:hypothetical protein